MELENTEFCPNCKKKIPIYNFLTHSAHCQTNIGICPKCNEPVPKKDMEAHQNEEHAIIRCDDCEGKLEKCKLEPHRGVCLKRKIACQYCEIVCIFDKLAEHENYCGSRTQRCLDCKQYIKIRDMKEHSEMNCEEISNGGNANAGNHETPSFGSGPHWSFASQVSEITSSLKKLLKPMGFNEDQFSNTDRNLDPNQGEDIQGDMLLSEGKFQSTNLGFGKLAEKTIPEHAANRLNMGILETCDMCDTLMPWSVIKNHVESCSLITYVCPVCNREVMNMEKKLHIEDCLEKQSRRENFMDNADIKLSKNQKKKMRKRQAGQCGHAANDSFVSPYPSARPFFTELPRIAQEVLLPCEFCDKSFPDYKLIQHQSGCRPDLLHAGTKGLRPTSETQPSAIGFSEMSESMPSAISFSHMSESLPSAIGFSQMSESSPSARGFNQNIHKLPRQPLESRPSFRGARQTSEYVPDATSLSQMSEYQPTASGQRSESQPSARDFRQTSEYGPSATRLSQMLEYQPTARGQRSESPPSARDFRHTSESMPSVRGFGKNIHQQSNAANFNGKGDFTERELRPTTMFSGPVLSTYGPRPRLSCNFAISRPQRPTLLEGSAGRGYRFRSDYSATPGMFLGHGNSINDVNERIPTRDDTYTNVSDFQFSDYGINNNDIYQFQGRKEIAHKHMPSELAQDSFDSESGSKEKQKDIFDCTKNFCSGRKNTNKNDIQSVSLLDAIVDDKIGKVLVPKCDNGLRLSCYSSDDDDSVDAEKTKAIKLLSDSKQTNLTSFEGARPKLSKEPAKLSPERKMNNRKNKKKK